ncbi:MAG TPA: methyltransferase domain-containing protein [Gemmatimonadaceae bacterium]|nr:methyltransferase domain-containing protein [Gemmatimonadaceae bacterium]
MSKPAGERLIESLERRFRTVRSRVDVAGREIVLLHPESAEDLIDERDFEQDERLPYWAEIWPSARILAAHVVQLNARKRTLLELGCGAGLVAAAATLAGFRVTVSDYYDDALRFARANAWLNDVTAPSTMLLDWRALPDDAARYDVIVASDVLYEREYGSLVARAIDALLADNGIAYLADPGRVGRDDFLRSLTSCDLVLRSTTQHRFAEGAVRQTITIYEIGRR